MARSCGSCTACCTVMAVAELKKAPHARCAHATASGCSVYAERPASCRAYECFWLQNVPGLGLSDEDRPDKLGLAFDTATGQGILLRACEKSGVGALIAREVAPGAADSPRARATLERLSARLAVVIVYHPGSEKGGGRSVIGPDAALHAIAEGMRAAGLEGGR